MDHEYFGFLLWWWCTGKFYVVHKDILVFQFNDRGLWGRSWSWVFVCVWQADLVDVQIFESVKHKNTQDDGDEARQRAHDIHSSHGVPLLEEDDGGGHYYRSEENVVDGEDQWGVKNIQCSVEEVDLNDDGKPQDERQDVGEGVSNNREALEEVPDGDTQPLDGSHREGADHRADDNVNEDIPLPITWGHNEDEDEARHHQKDSKYNEPFRKDGHKLLSEGCKQYLGPWTYSQTHVGSSPSSRPFNNSGKLLNS